MKQHPLASPTSRRNPCTDARRTETCVTPTCVVPRHVDASRDFYFFSERAAWGEVGGGALPDFFFFPCSADHERDWPPFKVGFFGLATNTLNVRNNNDNYNNRSPELLDQMYCRSRSLVARVV